MRARYGVGDNSASGAEGEAACDDFLPICIYQEKIFNSGAGWRRIHWRIETNR